MESDLPPSRPPPPPPPKRLSRPKITLQIPDATSPVIQRAPPTAGSGVYWGPNVYHPKGLATAGTHSTDPNNPYYNPFLHMYHNKASEFMFKQFAGFKDFTMNTAKSGLSAGEKTAFWVYNKLSQWSRKWFTHLFLTICLLLYSVMGAAIFMALEGPNEDVYDKNLTDIRQDVASWIKEIATNDTLMMFDETEFLKAVEDGLKQYEVDYTECVKHINNNDTKKKTWTFWNAMFYAGTIYTTIGKAFFIYFV